MLEQFGLQSPIGMLWLEGKPQEEVPLNSQSPEGQFLEDSTANGQSPKSLLPFGITAIRFMYEQGLPARQSQHPVLQEAARQLTAYFEGRQKSFDLPLAPQGTAFQQKVWQWVSSIGFGQKASYLDVARGLEQPKAVRAVGAANGQNPLPIVVPCHRIIGANGTLTGYAGGLPAKKWLLEHEAQLMGTPFQASLF